MANSKRKLRLAGAISSLLFFSACGGGDGGASAPPTSSVANPPSAPPPAGSETPPLNPAEAQKVAMDLWHNTDLSKHPKGSCAGCHGGDFLDLAVIGTTDEDILRRAVIDGATEVEADALVTAVKNLREQMNLVEQNARQFRPFQPGGEVLLPNLDDAPYIKSVKRDIAFGEQVSELLPTLFGPRIDSLEDAKKARDEMLDIAYGTNNAGANYRDVQLRDLQMGLEFPRWSSDLHHGGSEGTLNDWLTDIAHDAKPEFQEQWRAVQDDYLANPSRENFWKMYAAAHEMTEVQPLEACRLPEDIAYRCGTAKSFMRHKFNAALFGQHLMRLEELSHDTGFAQGPVAFSYLNDDPAFEFMREHLNKHGKTVHLPADFWQIGDRARVFLGNTDDDHSLRRGLELLGFPQFVIDSVDSERGNGDEEHELRVIWFWLGFTYDPSFARMDSSNSTKSGEYLIVSLLRENMHMQNAFQTHMRHVVKGTIAEGNVTRLGSNNTNRRIEYVEPQFSLDYKHFIRYRRNTIRWNEKRATGRVIPDELKQQQTDLWQRFNSNGFRMGLYLYIDSLENGGTPSKTELDLIKTHFDTYHPQDREADYALLNRVKALMGEEELFVVN